MQEIEEKKDLEEEIEDSEERDLKVYELGFLISPAVAEQTLPELVSSLKGEIEKVHGIFISEEYPKLLPLAYTIFKKTADQKNQAFNQAYFGWVKFEVSSSEALNLKKAFDTNANILRFLLIKTVKENTLYSQKIVVKRGKIFKKSPEDAGEKASVEEIDKSIDELVAKS